MSETGLDLYLPERFYGEKHREDDPFSEIGPKLHANLRATEAWARQVSPVVAGKPFLSVKAFGAKGDGVTDDTGAIQRAINVAQAIGAMLWFTVGTYKLTAALSITKALRLVGAGNASIIRQVTSGADALSFDCTNASIVSSGLRDIQLQGNNAARYGARFFGTNEFTMVSWENVVVVNFDTQVQVESNFDGAFRNCVFEYGHTTSKGIKTVGGRFFFEKCWWEGLTTALDHTGAAYVRLLEPKWAANVTTRLVLADSMGDLPRIILDTLESGGGIRFYGDPADDAFSSRKFNDTQDRYILNADGKMEWGSGSAAADTNLFRIGANILRTEDELMVGTPEGSPIAGRLAFNADGTGWLLRLQGRDGVGAVQGKPVSFYDNGKVDFHGNLLQLAEQADPVASPADSAFLFARDNGSGKTQLCVRFPTGAVQVLATEP